MSKKLVCQVNEFPTFVRTFPNPLYATFDWRWGWKPSPTGLQNVAIDTAQPRGPLSQQGKAKVSDPLNSEGNQTVQARPNRDQVTNDLFFNPITDFHSTGNCKIQ